MTKPFFYVLLAYTLLLLIPVTSQPIVPALDGAWGYALNYFLHSSYHFGPDVIFTYGPLGFLNNPQNVGHDIQTALVVHVLVWLALGIQLCLLFEAGERVSAFLFCFSLILGHALYDDYWDYYLLALTVVTLTKLFRHGPALFDLVLVPGLLGIGFLLKFTAFSIMIILLANYSGHLLWRRQLTRQLVLWLVVCLVSGPLAYFAYNPSIRGLGSYIKGSLQFASGFTTAMSTDGDPRSLALAGVVCVLLLIGIALTLPNQWFQTFWIVFVVWTVFRHSFVRADSSHAALFFGFSMLICAPLFTRLGTSILVYLALIAVCVNGMAGRYPMTWWPTTSIQTVQTIDDSLFDPLPGMAFRRAIEGKRVMIFPNATPYVAKIAFQMFPIYALQDYAAYTPFLDGKGARNLLNAKPVVDNVLVEWTSIDERNMMLDTPAMTMAFLSAYEPQQQVPGALLLKHRENALPVRLTSLEHQPFTPNGWVQVPVRDRLVAMSIKLKEDLAGILVTTLYRQEPVYIELQGQSGTVRRYRVPPQNLSTPEIISYVPQSLQEFEKLWSTEPLTDRVVKLRLTGAGIERCVSAGYDFYQVENAGVRVAPSQ